MSEEVPFPGDRALSPLKLLDNYRIDAKAGTIRPSHTQRQEQAEIDLCPHLDCDCIDIVDPSGDHIGYCDDNGLTDGLHCLT
ncbi:hypothetical protein C8J34_11613 [Rhizobium sp. PP-F2F-G36]|nr:hypothetical protein C8J34_11613 [Rhizobium sp. PP-F2F-G36]